MVLYEAASKAKKRSQTSGAKRKPVKTVLPKKTVVPAASGTANRGDRRQVKLYWAIGILLVVIVLSLYGISKLGDDGQATVGGGQNDKETPKSSDQGSQAGEEETDTETDQNEGTDEQDVPLSPDRTQEIVVASYAFSNELVPVKKYFAEKGIETEIVKSGRGYILVTVDKYISPAKPEGKAEIEAAKAKLKVIGAGYEPPSGYGSFTFDDIYVRKFR